MSFESLKANVQALPADARRKLMAFMVALQDREREGYAAKLTAKIDDKTSGRWLTAEQCERDLGILSDSQ